MDIKDITERAKKELAALTGFTAPKAIGVERAGKDWKVIVEIVEKESIPNGMDVLGIYAVKFSDTGSLLGYTRERMRKRNDTFTESGGE